MDIFYFEKFFFKSEKKKVDTRTANDSCCPGLKADNKIAICSSTNIELVLQSWKGKIEQILKSWKEEEKKNFFLKSWKEEKKKKANSRTATDIRRRG